MIVLLPALVPVAGALVVLAIARRRVAAVAVACLALAATVLAALVVSPGSELALGGGVLATTDYGRLAFTMLAVSGLLLGGAAAAAEGRPGALVALLAALPGAWIALVSPDPAIGGWAILAASVAALIGARLADGAEGRIGILAAALRAIVLAGAVGVAGIPVGASAAGGTVPDATVGGLAFIVVAGALALRSAAVPLHGWAARLADGVPVATLAATLAWLPTVAIGVTIAWTDGAMAPIAVDLDVERGILVAVALATLALASLAAWIADDLGHHVAYLAIAGTGTALLGIAALDPAAWTPTRTWLVVSAAAVTALAGWAVAVVGAYGTRWLPDLRGWARRSPVLAIALAAIGIAMVGMPGSPGLDARAALVDATIEGPLAGVSQDPPGGAAAARAAGARAGRAADRGDRPRRALGAARPTGALAGRRSDAAVGAVARARRGPAGALATRPPAGGVAPGAGDGSARRHAFGRRVRSDGGRRRAAAGGRGTERALHRADRRGAVPGTRWPLALALAGRPAAPPEAGSVGRGEHPAVDVARVVEQLVGPEPERQLDVGRLRPIRGVDRGSARSPCAKSPRIVPGAASVGRVAPTMARTSTMASGPSSTIATSGLEVMNSTSEPKNGRSRWTA